MYFPKSPTFSTKNSLVQIFHFTNFFLEFESNLLMNAECFLFNDKFGFNFTCFSFVVVLPKHLKYFAFSSCFCFIIFCTGIVVLKF
jgi:hypothetical protein